MARLAPKLREGRIKVLANAGGLIPWRARGRSGAWRPI